MPAVFRSALLWSASRFSTRTVCPNRGRRPARGYGPLAQTVASINSDSAGAEGVLWL